MAKKKQTMTLEELQNAFNLAKVEPEKNFRLIEDILTETSKVDIDQALNMWKELIAANTSYLHNDNFLVFSCWYSIEKGAGEELSYKKILHDPYLVEKLYREGAEIDNCACYGVALLLANNELELASQIFDYISKNRYKKESRFHILDTIILDDVKISPEAILLLSAQVNKIKDKTEKTSLRLKLHKLEEMITCEEESDEEEDPFAEAFIQALIDKGLPIVKLDKFGCEIKKSTDEKRNNIPQAITISPEADANAHKVMENAQQDPEPQPENPETDPSKELMDLIGLREIKRDVINLIDFVSIQQQRKEAGLKSVPVSLHLVFTGNPGTGKTTVARILAKLYKKIGVLSKGQLVEVDRVGLVAGYVGQTAIKTTEKIKESLGGVLFIDEAYSLAKDSNDDYGHEAIETILKAMEDYRDQFVVIAAGYKDEMQAFINSNPGLKSRFNKYFEFPDYSCDELRIIFNGMCSKYDYNISDLANDEIDELIENMVKNKEKGFANAREIRNLFEKVIANQASRVALIKNPSKEDYMMITEADIEFPRQPESSLSMDQ